MKLEPQHLLSISRVVLGGVVLTELHGALPSPLVLPAVAAACAADYADGIVARRRGSESDLGRLLDNLCDATFLGLVFAGFAVSGAWGSRITVLAEDLGRLLAWLPLLGLVLSFGSYLVRWGAAARMQRAPARSAFGHRAGVTNYLLALIGGVAVTPGVSLPPALLATLALGVSAFNVMAALDNLRLLARGETG